MHFIANTLNHCHTTESLPRLKALTYIRQGISAGFSSRWKRLLLDGGPKAGAKVTFGDQKAEKSFQREEKLSEQLATQAIPTRFSCRFSVVWCVVRIAQDAA